MNNRLTPCEQRGYKVGMRFRNQSQWFGGRPCNLILWSDDESDMPPFHEETDRERFLFVEIQGVKPIIRVRAGYPFEHLLPQPQYWCDQCGCAQPTEVDHFCK